MLSWGAVIWHFWYNTAQCTIQSNPVECVISTHYQKNPVCVTISTKCLHLSNKNVPLNLNYKHVFNSERVCIFQRGDVSVTDRAWVCPSQMSLLSTHVDHLVFSTPFVECLHPTSFPLPTWRKKRWIATTLSQKMGEEVRSDFHLTIMAILQVLCHASGNIGQPSLREDTDILTHGCCGTASVLYDGIGVGEVA